MVNSKRMTQNAHKITYLATQYPEHTQMQIIGLLGMPSIDINAAIWYAQDLGLLSEPDGETGAITATPPTTDGFWRFGEDLEELRTAILFCIEKTSANEKDIEENYLTMWTSAYPPHDLLIALKLLVNEGKIASYEVVDTVSEVEETYTFYTLPENLDKRWGEKEFRVKPTGKKPETKKEE